MKEANQSSSAPKIKSEQNSTHQTIEPRTIWSISDPRNCDIRAGRSFNTDLYDSVLSVRNQTDPRWPNQTTSVDKHSDQYCVFVDGQPVGCLGVTRALDGELFMQEYCPKQLIDDFYDTLGSAYRFRILAEYRKSSSLIPGVSLSRHLVREVWREQIAKGVALDIINIETSHVIFYQRMGYIHCEASDYVDPVLGTASSLMFLAADPDRISIVSDIIRESDYTVSTNKVLASLTRTRVYMNGV
jgi:hypothetical protein